MKIPILTTSLLLLFVASLASIKGTTAQCYDYTNALDISVRTPVACNIVEKINEVNEQSSPSQITSTPQEPTQPTTTTTPPQPSLTTTLQQPTATTKPPPPLSPPPPSSLPSPSNVTNQFIINYKCEIDSNQELCTKAQQSIQKVCEILTSSLNLVTNINVEVSLKNLCPTDVKQPCNELGGAVFGRTMELMDDDNMIREYPTALVKQFGCEKNYEFGDVDIRAIFNGGNATSLWFEGDPQITSDQKDFRAIVLKEFIKALGVQTSLLEQPIFANVTPKVLTPQLTLSEIAKENGGGLEFKGFMEYPFDKYLVLRGQQAQLINENIKPLYDFAKAPDNKFNDQGDFVTKFVQSPQIETAQRMANFSITQSTLGFQPRGAKSNDDIIVLETSLNPYQNGVSINSFDASVYASTQDFLMVSPILSGKTLEDSMGKFPSPLGPKLISLLETLGYPTKQSPNNDFKICNIPQPPPTQSVTTATTTTAVTTIVTATIPTIVTTTIQQNDTNVVETQTQSIVTKIESVSRRIVTTVKIVSASPAQETTSPVNGNNNSGDFSGGSSLNIQNNFILMLFITLISCIF